LANSTRRLLRVHIGRPAKGEAPSHVTLREAILRLFERPGDLPIAYESPRPKGVRRLRRLTPDAFEVEFEDEVKGPLLRQAAGGKYAIRDEDRAGRTVWRFPPRIVRNGEIVAYLNTSGRRVTVLLYPPPCQWTTYRRVLADLRGIKGFTQAYRANIEAIGLLETYRTLRYG